MTISIKDLKPCILVVYNVARRGGQHYTKDGEVTTLDEGGKEVQKWQTKKTTEDKEEFEAASKLQNWAKREIGKLGVTSPIGMVLNASRTSEVEELHQEVDQKVKAFNATSRFTRINYTLCIFNIAGENLASLNNLLDNLSQTMDALYQSVSSLDPANIRKTLADLKGYSDVLPETAALAVEKAIKSARGQANKLSRTERKIDRLDKALAEEVDGDADQAAEELRNRMAQFRNNPDKKWRGAAIRLSKLIQEKQNTMDQLDDLKRSIDTSAVNMARFAVMRTDEEDTSSQDDNDSPKTGDGAQQLNSLGVANRFNRVIAAPSTGPQMGVEF